MTETRVALVTGAAGGLGAALMRSLEDSCTAVVGVDREERDAILGADLSTPEGTSGVVGRVIAEHGQLDVLVLNAGLQHVAPLSELSDEAWDRLIAVMLSSPFWAMRAAWPSLTSSPAGRVIVTASMSSFNASPYKAAYVAAKHGVLGLVRTAALEAARTRLTVNAIAPTWMDTGMVEGQLDAQQRLTGVDPDATRAGFAAGLAAGRFVTTAEVAAAAVFLADPKASGVNGACLKVNLGGEA